MRKVLPWIILVWPYLLFPCGYFLVQQNNPFPLFIFVGLSLILFLANLFVILSVKDSDSGRRLAFWNIVMKLSHIPFYMILFFIATMTFAVPVIALFAIFFDCLLLITTSVHGIKALILAKKSITPAFLIVNMIAHLTFLLDVFSSVVLYTKLRKQAKFPSE